MRATSSSRCLLLLLSISVVAIRCQAGLKVVKTTFGVVRGQTIASPANNLPPVTQYLGIPYGVQSSGEYSRFNMAISAAKWTHMPKDAISPSKVCIQSGMPDVSGRGAALERMSSQRFDQIKRLQQHLSSASEDCLYMNLFVPEHLETKDKALPVLVLIHGDEYGWNAGNPYNATVLASYGQMIVVTLNYRLGVFGFLGRCEGDSCMGNSGISDIIAALKMLNNTLPAFGGDANMVTLLGWGSGASLVSLLMTSPMTQPSEHRLFKRAILLDGSALSPWAMIENPSPFFYMLAQRLQCQVSKEQKDGRPELISTDVILRCMQEHSADNITKAAREISVPTFLSSFAPVVDGQMVPNKPKLSFGSEFGSLFREIDLLVGMVSNPAHHLLADKDLTSGIEIPKRNQIFRTLVRNMFDFHRKEIFDAIVNEYTDWENPHDHPKTIRNGVLDALSDALYTAPLIDTARFHSGNDRNTQSNTFAYVFGHETQSWDRGDSATRIRGSITGEQLPYILGYPLWNKRDTADIPFSSQFNSEDSAMSRVLMRYVSNFVKSGDPAKPVPLSSDTQIEERFQQLAWPQFNEANREPYLEMGDRPRVKNYYRNAYVAFWNGFLPQLHAAGRENGVPDQHQFLADHFKKDSFFGDVRPHGGYANFPFPPPPLPPTPLPKEVHKPPSSSVMPAAQGDKTTEPVPAVNSQYSTILSVTVAVGCALLVLNICIFAGIYHQRDKQKRSKKKLQLQYHSYAAGDPNFSMNSPIAHQVSIMPPPPPPPGLIGGGMQSQMEMEPQTMRTFGHQHHHMAHIQPGSSNSMPRGGFAEQEPLLATSSGTMPRPGVSPTCPRHGRAAMAAVSARGGSMNGTLEEIQV